MDRRSWLWRRKSSDKSPGGETDSSVSGSISSPSERLSYEHQASPNQNIQSPEVNSKSMPPDEEVNDSMKILTEKLSTAVVTISAKEELIKQHAKVAEEAVSGWEKAENEVVTLKKQLDAAIKKNSSLEDRIVHLDGALKECLRELRQVKEEHNEKIQELICKKSQDTEPKNSDLEVQNSEIQAQLETLKKENASLHLELRSRLEELEMITLERDLSTKTAENASKQHLESKKRVAKLEAECRRFKTMARKTISYNDAKPTIECQSNNRERLNNCEPVKNGKAPSNTHVPASPEIGLMDDFLEMEKFAALPMSENKIQSLEHAGSLKLELEKKIEVIESEKSTLASELSQCQNKLNLSEAQLNTCQNQLKILQAQLREANKKIEMLQDELELANELSQAINLELDDANVIREEAESQCKAFEDEREAILSKVGFLEGKVEKGKALHKESSVKCQDLEDELSRLKHKFDSRKSRFESMKKLKEELEQELLSTVTKKEAIESQLKNEKSESKSLLAKIGSLEKEVENERKLSLEFSAKCKMFEHELSEVKHRLASANDSKDAVNEELKVMVVMKEDLESQLKGTLDKVSSLEYEVEKERKVSAEFSAKCKELEFELSKLKTEGNFQISPLSKEEMDREQEKELALAANKLAECKKTIASLGNQLKSLANLDDLFLESDNMLEVSRKESDLLPNNGVILDTLFSETSQDTSTFKENDGKFPKDKAKDGLISMSLEKPSKQGFGRLFSQARNMVKG